MVYQYVWGIFLFLTGLSAHAAMDNAQMSVWVNEGIVETYTYQYNNYLERQKVFAHYFTGNAWIAYIKALNASKVLDEVKKNKYSVSAVATMPPTITAIDAHHWKAVMPLLVRYNNAQMEQKQHLEMTVELIEAPSGEGVRGLAFTSIQAKKSSPICPCGSNQQ